MLIAMYGEYILFKVSYERIFMEIDNNTLYGNSMERGKYITTTAISKEEIKVEDLVNKIRVLLNKERDFLHIEPHGIRLGLSLVRSTSYPHCVFGISSNQLTLFKLGENLHEMHLDKQWFFLLGDRMKIYEGRLYDEKRRHIKVGHCIRFICRGCESHMDIYAVVVNMQLFKDFNEMLKNLPLRYILPGIKDVPTGLQIYRSYYGDKDKEYGAIALALHIL